MAEQTSSRWIWDDEIVGLVTQAMGENSLDAALVLISQIEDWNGRRITQDQERVMACHYAAGVLDGLASCFVALKAARMMDAAKVTHSVYTKLTARYAEEGLI